MGHLFALHAGGREVAVDLRPPDAPDLTARRRGAGAEGNGLAAFASGGDLTVIRDPAGTEGAAPEAPGRRLAAQMIVHVGHAGMGPGSLVDTQPFTQDGRAFAHDGVVGDLDRIEERLGSNRAMVIGDTDAERFFALVTLAIREARGDVRRGIRAAIAEVVESYELHSLNFVMGEPGHVWACRYPEHKPLHLLRRGPVDGDGVAGTDLAGTVRLRHETAGTPLVVIASEPVGGESGWEEVASGELVHVGPELEVDRQVAVVGPPEHPMALSGPAAKTRSYA